MDQSGEINEENDGVTSGSEMGPSDKPCSFMDPIQKRFTIAAIKAQQVADIPGEELFQMVSDDDDDGQDDDVDADMMLAWDKMIQEIGEEEEECPELSSIAVVNDEEAMKLVKGKFVMRASEKEMVEELGEIQKRLQFPSLSLTKELSLEYLQNPQEYEETGIEHEHELGTEMEGEGEQHHGDMPKLPDDGNLSSGNLASSSPPACTDNGPKSPEIQQNNLGESNPASIETEAEANGRDKLPSTSAVAASVEPEEPEDAQNETATVIVSQIKQEVNGQAKIPGVTAMEIESGVTEPEPDSHHDAIPMDHDGDDRDGDNPNDLPTEDQIPTFPALLTLKVEVPPSPQSLSPKPNIAVPAPPTIVLPARKMSAKVNKSPPAMTGDPLAEVPVPRTLFTTPSYEPVTSNGKQGMNVVFSCHICLKHFSLYDDNLLRKHLVTRHGFVIEDDEYFNKRMIPATHITSNSQKPLKHGCAICGNVFPARFELKRHIEASHTNFTSKIILWPGFQCAECLKGFNSSFELTDHSLKCSDKYPCPDTIREMAKNFLDCDLCGVSHPNTHQVSQCYFRSSMLRCALCCDIFKNKDNFFKHLHLYHGLQFKVFPKFTLPCPFCMGSNACSGKYQEIFPHIVADHYQQSLDALVPSFSRGAGHSYRSTNNAVAMGQQSGEPGFPIVVSVVGNYTPPKK